MSDTYRLYDVPTVLVDPVEVMEDTWGHLRPQPRRSYKGSILFAVSAYSAFGVSVIDTEFDGLPGSPWFYEDLCDWLNEDERYKLEPGVYRFTGTYRASANPHKHGVFKGATSAVDTTGAQS